MVSVITLFNDLSSLITLHDNCNEDERQQQKCEAKDILEWIRTVAIPEFEAVDQEFIDNEQKLWIRSQ